MAELSRRTFLRATTGAAGAVAVTSATDSVAQATPGVSVHESVVRDAAPRWRSLPLTSETAPFLGNGRLTAQVFGGTGATSLRFPLSAGTRPAVESAGLTLHLAGTVTAVDWELDLWDAALHGSVTTTRGSLEFSAFVHRTRDVLVVSRTAAGAEAQAAWTANGPLWQEKRDGTTTWLAASLPETGARATVDDALAAGADDLASTHRAWWHGFYPAGFVSVPDRELQRFHYIQLYKAASATPADGGSSLAVPAAYPLLGAIPVTGHEPAARPGLGALAVPGSGSKNGSAEHPILIAHRSWLGYRYQMDDAILRESIYEPLAAAVGFHSQFLADGRDGRLHLPLTHSPDYADAADCVHDLALLRWGSRTLIDSARRLGIQDARAGRWADITARLADYPRDEHGIMVGAGTPFTGSHPNPAHMVWLHPLRENGIDAGLARRTLDRWAARQDAWEGGSLVAASAMSAALGDENGALAHLKRFTSMKGAAGTRLLPNTFYSGHGEETPLAAAQAMLDMLVLGTETSLAIFPATPWHEVSVSGLRTPGGLVVDASREDGRTRWLRVSGGTGAEITVHHRISDAVVHGGASRPAAPGTLTLRLARGESALITARGDRPDTEPRVVPAEGSAAAWGLPTSDLAVLA